MSADKQGAQKAFPDREVIVVQWLCEDSGLVVSADWRCWAPAVVCALAHQSSYVGVSGQGDQSSRVQHVTVQRSQRFLFVLSLLRCWVWQTHCPSGMLSAKLLLLLKA